MMTPQLWPIFICYRRADGIASARRLHEILDKWNTSGPDGKPIQLDVYLDETMPGVENWKELHRPYLEKARAMIVICTPGTKLNEGPGDHVHNEINWWLKNRKVAPILIDPLMEGERFVPSQIVRHYPDIQRIGLDEKEWKCFTDTGIKEKTVAILRQILGAILPSGAEIYLQELEQERLRARRLRFALSVSIVLLVATMVFGIYALFQRHDAVVQRNLYKKQAELTRRGAYNVQLARVRDLIGRNPDLALELLKNATYCPLELRDFTWGFFYRLSKKAQITLTGHTGIVSLAFSPDGKTLASAGDDNTITLWNLETGKKRATLSGHLDRIQYVAFAPDGKTLASVSEDNTIRLWDSENGKEHATLSGHMDEVQYMAFFPDGKILASVSEDNTIRLWDSRAGQKRVELTGHIDWPGLVAFSPDGKTLASESEDMNITLWNLETGKERATLSGHMDRIQHMAFSPDSKTLASASQDSTIKLWNAETGKERATLSVHKDWGQYMTFSPDGKTLASVLGQHIMLWDTKAGQERIALTEHSDKVRSVSFSPDGKTLASASWDNTIKLWDAKTRQVRFTLEGHFKGFYSVAFSPDGETLASAGEDNTIRLWDAKTGQARYTLTGHTDWVSSVAFSPDSKALASASADNTIKLWEAASSVISSGIREVAK